MVSKVVPATETISSRRRTHWVHGPVLDVSMALCWVPFAVADSRYKTAPTSSRGS